MNIGPILSYIALRSATTNTSHQVFFPLRIMEYDNDWKYGRNHNHGINITETYWIYPSLHVYPKFKKYTVDSDSIKRI